MILDNLHFSYDTYIYTAFIIPLIILGICLVSLLVVAYAILLVCWPLKKRVEHLASEELPHLMSEFRGKKFPCWTPVYGGLRLIYGTHIKECGSLRQENIYVICGRHVRPWLLIVLFTAVIFVCSCTGVAFWCNFIVTESNHCDKHMDCFAMEGTRLEEVNGRNPLENCSSYENTTYNLHCFRFSFDYASAIGDASGIMVLATVIMNAQAGLWIAASSQEGKVAWCVSVALVTALNIVIELGLILTPIIVQLVPLFRSRITGTDTTAVQFYSYLATFLFTFTVSGPVFIIFSKRLRFSTDIDGEEQYISTTTSSKKRMRLGQSAAMTDSESDGEEFIGSGHHVQNNVHTKYGSVH